MPIYYSLTGLFLIVVLMGGVCPLALQRGKMKTSDAKQFTRLATAAKFLDISPRTLREWANRRLVPCYRPTKRFLLFDLDEIRNAMAKYKMD